MSVTTAAGFEAAGVEAGLKASGGLDVALVVNRGPRFDAAAVFTSNRAQAHPIIWSKQVIDDGVVTAIALNSGGANCFTGPQGFQVTHATAEHVAESLGASVGDILVCSTGLIGEQLPQDKILAGMSAAVEALNAAFTFLIFLGTFELISYFSHYVLYVLSLFCFLIFRCRRLGKIRL